MVLEGLMVPKAGLEPARISTVDFESTASTDFATSALKGMRKPVHYTRWRSPCNRYPPPRFSTVEKTGAMGRYAGFSECQQGLGTRPRQPWSRNRAVTKKAGHCPACGTPPAIGTQLISTGMPERAFRASSTAWVLTLGSAMILVTAALSWIGTGARDCHSASVVESGLCTSI